MKKVILFISILSYSLSFAQAEAKTSAADFQENLNKSFLDTVSSPLKKEDLKTFKGLDFFPIDRKYIVKAKFIKSKKEKVFKMKTSTERTPSYKKYGELFFTIDGKQLQLNVYQNIELMRRKEYKNHLFLPFTDLTCGKLSYESGRYIDIQIPESDAIIIDFNKAYNPYCAYNFKYSCPIVPSENYLAIEINAGVKKFHD